MCLNISSPQFRKEPPPRAIVKKNVQIIDSLVTDLPSGKARVVSSELYSTVPQREMKQICRRE